MYHGSVPNLIFAPSGHLPRPLGCKARALIYKTDWFSLSKHNIRRGEIAYPEERNTLSVKTATVTPMSLSCCSSQFQFNSQMVSQIKSHPSSLESKWSFVSEINEFVKTWKFCLYQVHASSTNKWVFQARHVSPNTFFMLNRESDS